jgi:replicative DNA helicase
MTSTPQASQPQESHQHYEAERELIKLLLNHTSFVKNVAQQIDSSYFLTHVNREIFKVLLHNEEEPETLARLLNQDDTDEFPQIIITMMMEPVSEAENLDSFVTELKIRKYQAELTAVNKAIRTGEMHPDLIARKKSILDTLRSLGVKTVRKTLY